MKCSKCFLLFPLFLVACNGSVKQGNDVVGNVETGTADDVTVSSSSSDASGVDIKKELAEYIAHNRQNPNVELSRMAEEFLFESSWPEIQCVKTGQLDAVGKNITVEDRGDDWYVYSCDCFCGEERYHDNYFIHAIVKNGKVYITNFKIHAE